ncbi:metallophosphoesterase family protein [Psychrobacillus vulpis]|uniref:Calcineurin-like phosphoesterase domain-containing protein n=1 Tax=Psychrobacillus vulpis TaxID=2325572 RepID=A0A544TDI2_9BACI|nr:metallophosphoesterase [Psychrobacillus vulpis]TQR15502.1 hypothetical protein FG384_19270 [Psychrobacillus vulpis]
MILSIIHLTDLHFNLYSNPILEKTEKLCSSIISQVRGSEFVIFCISGDIANTGHSEEYDNHARGFFDNIKELVKSEAGIECDIIFIPGNHDCDFSNKGFIKTRELLISTINSNTVNNLDHHTISEIKKIQNNFEKFKEAYHDSWIKCETQYTSPLVDSISLTLNDKKITINLINSSWISQIDEKPGQMFYPVKEYSDTISDYSGDINISLIHHPDHWLHPDNRREMRDMLENVSDFILSGHEHVTSNFLVTNWDKKQIQFIEGTSLQDIYDSKVSGYNVLHFNIIDQTYQIKNCSWNLEYYDVSRSTKWVTLLPNQMLKGKGNLFLPSETYQSFINDNRLPISHPRKAELEMNDLYIFPHVEEVDFENDEKKTELLEIPTIIKDLLPGTHLMFLGDKDSGKTTLSQVLFKNFIEEGNKPVMTQGISVVPSVINQLDTFFDKVITETYSSESVELYNQLPKSEKVLIIDNWHECKLNQKYKSVFLSRANNYFTNIIIFSLSSNRVNDTIGLTSFDDKYKLRVFEIQEFGYVKRDLMVEKWILLGQEETLTEEELIIKKDRVERILDPLLGKSFVPRYPIYLLVILKAIESGNPHNFDKSSNGYYYEVLIKDLLGTIQLANNETDKLYNYLTELAYNFYQSKTKSMMLVWMYGHKLVKSLSYK